LEYSKNRGRRVINLLNEQIPEDRVPKRPKFKPGPALGMFEVFSRTGLQNLGGLQFWTPKFRNDPIAGFKRTASWREVKGW